MGAEEGLGPTRGSRARLWVGFFPWAQAEHLRRSGWGGSTPGDHCFPTQPSLRGHNRPEAGSLESAMEVEGDTWKGWMPLYWQARIFFCPQVGLGTPTTHKVITFPQSNLWLKNMPAVHENTWILRGFAFENCPSLLMKVKEESEKAGLKLNIKNTKIMASSPITAWQIGKKWKQWQTLFSWTPKSLQTVTAAVKLKDIAPWKKSNDKPRQYIKKQRRHFANKGLYSQSYSFFSSHVQMWELDHKDWAPKNWCFWTLVLEKTLESPLDSKDIKSVNPKENQSWIFIGRTDAETEAKESDTTEQISNNKYKRLLLVCYYY